MWKVSEDADAEILYPVFLFWKKIPRTSETIPETPRDAETRYRGSERNLQEGRSDSSGEIPD